MNEDARRDFRWVVNYLTESGGLEKAFLDDLSRGVVARHFAEFGYSNQLAFLEDFGAQPVYVLVRLLLQQLALVPVPEPPIPPEPLGLLDGIVAHWTMGEASGNRLDSVGTNHLVPLGEPTQVEGKLGNATQFSPTTSDFLMLSPSTPDVDLNGKSYTWAAWVFMDSLGLAYLLSKGPDSVQLAYDGNYFTFLRRSEMVQNSSVIEAGEWVFLVCSYDKDTQLMSLWVNNSPPAQNIAVYTDELDGTDLFFGYDSDSGLYFAGRLNSVSLWHRVLTSTERTQLWNGGAGLAYPF